MLSIYSVLYLECPANISSYPGRTFIKAEQCPIRPTSSRKKSLTALKVCFRHSMWHDHCINSLTVASSEMKLQTKNVIKTSMITDRKSTEINLK